MMQVRRGVLPGRVTLGILKDKKAKPVVRLFKEHDNWRALLNETEARCRVDQEKFTGEVVRNLIYHIWPVKGDHWRWNVDQLIERIDQFNGRKIIGIAYGGIAEDPEVVMSRLDGRGCEFVVRENSHLGEVVTFPVMMNMIRSVDENEITFYGHAKGVKYEPEVPRHLKRWVEIQYRVCLDNWDVVIDQLERFPITGPFLRAGKFSAHHYLGRKHYSGTYFFLRHSTAFKICRTDVPMFYGGVEVWPGIFFKEEEMGCLFAPIIRENLYDPRVWDKTINPLFKGWEDGSKAQNTTKTTDA